jgi:hypothetical protein
MVAPPAGGGGKSKKSGRASMMDDKRELLARLAVHKLFGLVENDSTLHHKFSRSHLKNMVLC